MLIIVRGLPGSGKTTFVKKVYTNILHVESDMLTVVDGAYSFDPDKLKARHEACQRIVETALSIGADVAVSNTFTTMRELQPYIDMANKYHTRFVVTRMIGTFENVHNVPQDVLDKMAARFEDYPGESIMGISNGAYKYHNEERLR